MLGLMREGEGLTMDVGCSSGVVSGENGIDLEDSRSICECNSSKHGVVYVRFIGSVAIVVCDDTTVDSLS